MELLLRNNVPAEEQVKDPVRFIGTNGYKVIVVGNSITLHSPKPEIGWTGDFGMRQVVKRLILFIDYTLYVLSAEKSKCVFCRLLYLKNIIIGTLYLTNIVWLKILRPIV